ncbi:lasso peptide biosynthesis B2 protein [Streptosporangium sp. NPDC006930]|uniref:lasso peptide biosynthesis B2 protein n=1 Tax=unclassified Streptosporangium TaxID=2632669 RepID=UPI0034232D2E
MTMPVTLEASARITWRRRLAAHVAVSLARVLMRLSPLRLRRLLMVIRRGAGPCPADRALAARTAVVTVSVQCAGQGCLQRSIATVLLCRFASTWPTWCTGVLTEPFRAHAWVEVDGVPIGERDEIRHFHRTMVIPLMSAPARLGETQ